MSDINNINQIPQITSQEISTSSNFAKLMQNKDVKKLDRIFRGVKTRDYQVDKKTLAKHEGQSEDWRAEYDTDDYYNIISGYDMLMSSVSQRNASSKYLSMLPKQRRLELQRLSNLPEIDNVLEKLTNEVVVTKRDQTNFAIAKVNEEQLKKLKVKDSVIEQINESLTNSQYKFYNLLNFEQNGAWDKFYKLAVEGVQAFEIVYDNLQNPKNIIGFVWLDAYNLKEHFKAGRRYWILETRVPKSGLVDSRVLYDNQVCFIQWSSISTNSKFSYIEGLMQSYNMLRIITEAKLIYAATNSTFRTVMAFPTQGMSRKRAAETVAKEKMRYIDDVSFNYDTGEISVNGEPNLQFNKTMYLANGDQGKPEIETLGSDGQDLMNLEQDEFFTKRFHRSTGLPQNRFDEDGGDTWNLDPTNAYRTEIAFGRKIDRCRNIFGKTLLQPITQQLLLDIPDIRGDNEIINAIYLDWTAYNMFEQQLEMEVLSKTVDFINDMRNNLKIESTDGDEKSFFPLTYLLKKHMHLTEEDIKIIEAERLEELKTTLKFRSKEIEIAGEYGLTIEEEDDLY